MNGIGISGELLAAIAASMVSVLANFFVNKLRDVPIFRRRRRLVTLTGGKTEYLSSRASTEADYADSLSHYLQFEELVRVALEDALSTSVTTRSSPDHADFAVQAGSKIILIEAKTHPEAVSARELNKLIRAEEATGMIFITPHPLPDDIASRFVGLTRDGKMQLIHGESRESLSARIRSAFDSVA